MWEATVYVGRYLITIEKSIKIFFLASENVSDKQVKENLLLALLWYKY